MTPRTGPLLEKDKDHIDPYKYHAFEQNVIAEADKKLTGITLKTAILPKAKEANIRRIKQFIADMLQEHKVIDVLYIRSSAYFSFAKTYCKQQPILHLVLGNKVLSNEAAKKRREQQLQERIARQIQEADRIKAQERIEAERIQADTAKQLRQDYEQCNTDGLIDRFIERNQALLSLPELNMCADDLTRIGREKLAKELYLLAKLLEKKGIKHNDEYLQKILHLGRTQRAIIHNIENKRSTQEYALAHIQSLLAKQLISKDDRSIIAALLTLHKTHQIVQIEDVARHVLEQTLKKTYDQNHVGALLCEEQEAQEVAQYEQELSKGAKQVLVKLDDLATMEPFAFEQFLGNVFRQHGYQVQLTSKTGDQGADLIATKGEERIAIQAKRYKETVSNKAVQEVTAAIKHYRCTKGMVITTGTFTQSARTLARSNSIELWDGHKLIAYINNP